MYIHFLCEGMDLLHLVFACRERVSQEFTFTQSRARQLAQQGPALVAEGDRLLAQAVEQVQALSVGAMRNILAQLSAMVDNFERPFDSKELGLYRAGLFSYFDEQLAAELERMNSSALGRTYEAAQGNLIGACEIKWCHM